MILFRKGSIEAFTNDTQLSTIVAHGLAEVVERHVEKVLATPVEEVETMKRQHELGAEYLGLMIMASTVYKPKAAIECLQRVKHQGVYS